jgi:translation initiation factor 3 subunit G
VKSKIMPTILDEVKSSWADEVEEVDHSELPPPTITWDKDIKTITEYKRNEEGKKVKVVRKVRVETKKVLKSVARRRTLKKFGQAKDDGPGPDPATTIVAEDVYMQFVSNKDLDEQQNDESLAKVKGSFVKCRICRGDHWSASCPYKDKLGEGASLAGAVKPKEENKLPVILEDKSKPAKYVPPSKRGEGASKGGETMSRKSDQDFPTVRVTNLSESTRETDLQELFKSFGNIIRVYLGRDKNSGASKGFAFISFAKREDAQRAINTLNGYGYDHLILSVEWSKPQN